MFTSIKLKIIALISIFFAIVLFLTMLYSLEKEKLRLDSYLSNLNKTSASLLIKNIRADLNHLNYSEIKNTIDSFDNNYFENIYVLTKKGYIFAQRKENIPTYDKYTNFEKIEKKQTIKSSFFQPILVSNTVIGYLVIKNNNKIFQSLKDEKRKDIINLFIVLLFVTVLISYFLSSIITKPIHRIVENLKKLDKDSAYDFYHSNDEYGYLSKIIEKNYKNIQNLNNNLEQLVEEEIDKNRQKDKILQEQSIKASMGGMMDAVAHQWMQPLSIIKMNAQDLEIKSDFNTLTKEDIQNSYNNTFTQVEHMRNTLEEFRSFFKENKETQKVNLCKLIESTLALMKNDLIKNQIEVEINCQEDKEVNLIANEFKHVLINIINNSKDAFILNDIKKRKVLIDIFQEDEKIKITIADNAGGIPKELLPHVFEANFTSKEKGSGVGLYLSQIILEKIDAKIEASSQNSSACFTITLKA